MAEHAWFKTRLGWVHLQGNEAGLTRLTFIDKPPAQVSPPGPFTANAVECLERYFAGDLNALTHVATAPAGTAFQRRVWRALMQIPAGALLSYAELAEGVGQPRAIRAVGQANAKNPIALVVPCHRVVASDGSLGGYAWGAERKAWLLEHERGAMRPAPARSRPKTRRTRASSPSPLPLFERISEKSPLHP